MDVTFQTLARTNSIAELHLLQGITFFYHWNQAWICLCCFLIEKGKIPLLKISNPHIRNFFASFHSRSGLDSILDAFLAPGTNSTNSYKCWNSDKDLINKTSNSLNHVWRIIFDNILIGIVEAVGQDKLYSDANSLFQYLNFF